MSNIHEFIIGFIISVFFGIILFLIIPNYIDAPFYVPAFVPGPSLWPKMIVELSLFLGIILLLSSSNKMVTSNSYFNHRFIFDYLNSKSIYIKRFIVIFIILIIYIILIKIIGFPLSSIFLLGVLLFSTGTKRNLKINIIVSLSFPCILYFVFTEITNTSFPTGGLWSFVGLN